MSLGPIRPYTVTIASGATLSAEIDLGKAWSKVYLDPTGAASEVRLQAAAVASAAGGTYRQIYYQNVASTSAGILKVGSAVSGGLVEVALGAQFVKVETTAAVANGATLKLICSD